MAFSRNAARNDSWAKVDVHVFTEVVIPWAHEETTLGRTEAESPGADHGASCCSFFSNTLLKDHGPSAPSAFHFSLARQRKYLKARPGGVRVARFNKKRLIPLAPNLPQLPHVPIL